jgi:hypothetical protein
LSQPDLLRIAGLGKREVPGIHSPETASDARATTLALLARRARGATICPSEVARTIAAAAGKADWRGEMSAVHAAIDAMVTERLIWLSWKGKAMAVREGPYRIGQGDPKA